MATHQDLSTPRLQYRRPLLSDATELYARIASDPVATRYVSWSRHASPASTKRVLSRYLDAWDRDGLGPLLVFERVGGRLVGTTGLQPTGADSATTGYVFARDAWGQGYATEALGAMVELAQHQRISRLHACVHPENQASVRVLEKNEFQLQGRCREDHFPNLGGGERVAVLDYRRTL